MEEVAAVERIVDLARKWGRASALPGQMNRHSRLNSRRMSFVVAPFNAQVNRLTERLAPGRAGWNGGQIPGTGSAGRDLLDGHVTARRRAAWNGIPL